MGRRTAAGTRKESFWGDARAAMNLSKGIVKHDRVFDVWLRVLDESKIVR